MTGTVSKRRGCVVAVVTATAVLAFTRPAPFNSDSGVVGVSFYFK